MQPIERYGLVTLLFVVVAVVAVLAWDGPGADPADQDETAQLTRTVGDRRADESDAARRAAAREQGTREQSTREQSEREERAAKDAQRANRRTTPPIDGAASRTNTSLANRSTAGAGSGSAIGSGADDGKVNNGTGAAQAPERPTGTGYNPFGGAAPRAGDASFVAPVDDAASGLSGIPVVADATAQRDTSRVDGITGPRGVQDARAEDARLERRNDTAAFAFDGLANDARNGTANNASLVDASTPDRNAAERRTERNTASATNSRADERAATGLPTGPFVVETVLSKQLAREYGSAYALFGSNGLVAAFEAANPGVNVDRLGLGDTLRRPAPDRIAAARKSSTGASVANASAPTTNAAAPKVSKPSTAPATTRTTGGALAYVIQSGDTLSGIALRTLGSASAYPSIEALNPGIDSSKLRVGDTILLPSNADVTARATTVASSTPAKSSESAASDRPRIR